MKIVKTPKGWGILKPDGRYVDDCQNWTKEQAEKRLELIKVFNNEANKKHTQR